MKKNSFMESNLRNESHLRDASEKNIRRNLLREDDEKNSRGSWLSFSFSALLKFNSTLRFK